MSTASVEIVEDNILFLPKLLLDHLSRIYSQNTTPKITATKTITKEFAAPDLLVYAVAKTAMPGYESGDMNLRAKLCFAGSECYWSYKTSQEPVEPTTADIVVPYIADMAAGVTAYANGYGLMGVVTSVVAADWMSKMVMDAAPNNIKENIEDTFKFLGEIYEHGSNISY